MYVYIYIYISQKTNIHTARANLRTKILDFIGFYSSRI